MENGFSQQRSAGSIRASSRARSRSGLAC